MDTIMLTVHLAHVLHVLISQYHAGAINKGLALSYLRGEYKGMGPSFVHNYLGLQLRYHTSPANW
jgi:hypothetical protein